MARMIRGLFCCALSVLFVGCKQHGTLAPTATGAMVASAPTADGWKEFRVAEISFEGPAELVDRQIGGRDGTAGSFVSDSMWVTFVSTPHADGSFDGRFDGKTMRDGTVEHVRIDGRAARLGTWRDGWPPRFPYCCAIYVPDLAWASGRGRMKLDFSVSYRDAADAELARKIVLSVRIAPPTR